MRSKEEIINDISKLVCRTDQNFAINYLRGVIDDLNSNSNCSIERIIRPMQSCFIRAITRSEGKRALCISLIQELLLHVGTEESLFFKKHFEELEYDLNQSGRSFLIKYQNNNDYQDINGLI